MCSTVPSATEGNLHNPTFGRALGGIVEQRFLIETKEDFLDDILGFTAVIQDAKRNCEHQPRIATEEQIQSLCIFDLEANHEFFVAWGANLSGLGRCDRVLSTRTPYYGECQRAPIQRRAHFTMVALLDTKRETPDRCPFPHIYRASAKRARKHTTDCKRFSRQKLFRPPAKTWRGWYKFAISAVSTGSVSRSDFLSPRDWLMVVFGSRAEEEISEWYRTT